MDQEVIIKNNNNNNDNNNNDNNNNTNKNITNNQELISLINQCLQTQQSTQLTIEEQQLTIEQQQLTINHHEQEISSLNQTLTQQQQQLETLLQKLNKLEHPYDLIPLNKKSIQEIKWSTTLRSSKIQINNNGVNKLYAGEFSQEFILVETKFDYQIRRKQCWAIKINSLKILGYVGVCNNAFIQEQEKTNFSAKNSTWNNPYHGLYVLCSNGNSHSHSNKEQNNSYKSFKFSEGDVIYIEYDPINWVLRFRKNHSLADREEMRLIPITDDKDAYYPCVMLSMGGEGVELVLPGEMLS